MKKSTKPVIDKHSCNTRDLTIHYKSIFIWKNNIIENRESNTCKKLTNFTQNTLDNHTKKIIWSEVVN